MMVIEDSMEQSRNERAGETEDPREKKNPQTNGIVRHDSHIRRGIKSGSFWWEASKLTAQTTWPHFALKIEAAMSSETSGTTKRDMVNCKSFSTINVIYMGQYLLGSPLVDGRLIMNVVKYRLVSGVVWTNRTMMSSNTNTNRTGVHAVVDIGDSLLIHLKCHARLGGEQGACTWLACLKRSRQPMTSMLPTVATTPSTQMQTRSTRFDMRSSHDENSSAGGRHTAACRARQQKRNSSVTLRHARAASLPHTLHHPIQGETNNSKGGPPPSPSRPRDHQGPSAWRDNCGRECLICTIPHETVEQSSNMLSSEKNTSLQMRPVESFQHVTHITVGSKLGWTVPYTIERLSFAYWLPRSTGASVQDLVNTHSHYFFQLITGSQLNGAAVKRGPIRTAGEKNEVLQEASNNTRTNGKDDTNNSGVKQLLIPRTTTEKARKMPSLASKMSEQRLTTGAWRSTRKRQPSEPGLIPGRFTPDFVPDDTVGWQIFSEISRFPPPIIPAPLHTHFTSPSSALKELSAKSHPNLFTHYLLYSLIHWRVKMTSLSKPLDAQKTGEVVVQDIEPANFWSVELLVNLVCKPLPCQRKDLNIGALPPEVRQPCEGSVLQRVNAVVLQVEHVQAPKVAECQGRQGGDAVVAQECFTVEQGSRWSSGLTTCLPPRRGGVAPGFSHMVDVFSRGSPCSPRRQQAGPGRGQAASTYSQPRDLLLDVGRYLLQAQPCAVDLRVAAQAARLVVRAQERCKHTHTHARIFCSVLSYRGISCLYGTLLAALHPGFRESCKCRPKSTSRRRNLPQLSSSTQVLGQSAFSLHTRLELMHGPFLHLKLPSGHAHSSANTSKRAHQGVRSAHHPPIIYNGSQQRTEYVSEGVWAALNSEVLRADVGEAR
ncbi:hypothetical protein PR048_014241 [Dryococelus australis]|uniref:Uncharacterized protein n=1 Tax=Dryococelus australis TaxID=614101 RepID=A0ABQ9HDP2_9NEOP|nr:hypothetical protein PR048_014241 [Dryococelus australis]